MRELIDAEVVRNNLDGIEVHEGEGLLEVLISNASKIKEDAWLEWLTSIRGLLRVASLQADDVWIASLNLPGSRRRIFLDENLLPVRISGGSWLCASLRGDKEWRERWEAELKAPVVLLAPTLAELKVIRQKYQGS